MTEVQQPRLQTINRGPVELTTDDLNRAFLQSVASRTIPLTEAEQRYLEQLNMEVLYAQKAYFGFLNHLRRVYGCPDGEWAMNNINVGFERIEVSE